MGSTPKYPDPAQTAATQRAENTWTSQYNTIGSNANVYTPYGSVTSSPGSRVPIYDEKGNITGYGTQWNQTTKLSPEQQQLYDLGVSNQKGLGTFANQQIGQLSSVLGKPFDTSGMVDWSQYGAGPSLRNDTTPTDRASIEKAMMDSYNRGVAPQQAAQDAQLAARGQMPGSKMDYTVQQGRGDAAAEQTRQAYLASGGESRAAQEEYNKVAQQGWLNDNTRSDQQNQLRTAQFGEKQQLRNQLVNEIAALMGGSQVTVPQGQGFQGSQINPFDYNSAYTAKFNADNAAYQNKMSGLFGIAGAGLQMLNPFSMFGKGMGMMGGG